MDHTLTRKHRGALVLVAILALLVTGVDQITAQMAFAPNNGYMRRLLRMRLPINNPELLQNAMAAGFNPAVHHTGYLIISTRVGLAPTRRPTARPLVYGPSTTYVYTSSKGSIVNPSKGSVSGSFSNITVNIGTSNTMVPYNFPVRVWTTSISSSVYQGGANIYVGAMRPMLYSPFQSFVSGSSSGGGSGGGGTTNTVPGGGGTGPGGGGTGPGGGGTGPGGGGGPGVPTPSPRP